MYTMSASVTWFRSASLHITSQNVFRGQCQIMSSLLSASIGVHEGVVNVGMHVI